MSREVICSWIPTGKIMQGLNEVSRARRPPDDDDDAIGQPCREVT